MNKKVLIIYNPVSGTKSNKAMISQLLNYYKLNNINYFLLKTEYKNHAKEFCANNSLAEYDDLIVCGGDGTFNEVINGVVINKNKKIPRLGFLPGGTGNSFMHDLNAVEPNKAINKIIKNNSDTLDILKLTYNHKTIYSFNIVGWGLVTDILILAEKMRFLKSIRYNVASLFYILTAKGKKIKFIIDNNKIYNGKYLFILICNTIHTGKGMKAAPKAKFNDGQLDIVGVKSQISSFQLIKLFTKIFTGKHIHSPFVDYINAQTINLIPENNEVLNVDGDARGGTPVKIKILKNKLSIIN
tara:strand:- start:3939 stop:4835 length:897 start_codon:yes stop_codon:yes gene_type:complete